MSVYTSKSGVSIFGLILVLGSLYLVNWKDFYKEKHLIVAMALYPLAIFCNLFSLGGVQSSLKIIYSWPWPLMVLPAYVVSRRRTDWRIGLWGLVVGLLISSGMAAFRFVSEYGGNFASNVRVTAFWDIGRWGVFLSVTSVVLLALTCSPQIADKRKKMAFAFLFVLSCVLLALANTRAPWIAFGVAFTLFCLLPPRRWGYLFGFISVVVLVALLNSGIRSRLVSIAEVKKDGAGRITSTNESNAGRLHMWKVALDFYKEQPWFGTGFENVESPLRAFLSGQSAEYLEKYTKIEFSYRDQHSSYLAVLVQMGVFFFVVFWLYWVWILVGSLIAAIKGIEGGKILFLVLLSHLIIFVFYSSFGSYEMVALFPFLVLLKIKKEVLFKV